MVLGYSFFIQHMFGFCAHDEMCFLTVFQADWKTSVSSFSSNSCWNMTADGSKSSIDRAMIQELTRSLSDSYHNVFGRCPGSSNGSSDKTSLQSNAFPSSEIYPSVLCCFLTIITSSSSPLRLSSSASVQLCLFKLNVRSTLSVYWTKRMGKTILGDIDSFCAAPRFVKCNSFVLLCSTAPHRLSDDWSMQTWNKSLFRLTRSNSHALRHTTAGLRKSFPNHYS